MITFLTRAIKNACRQPAAKRSRPSRRVRPAVEVLEDRQLLSHAPLHSVVEQEPNNLLPQQLERAVGTWGWNITGDLDATYLGNYQYKPDRDLFTFQAPPGQRFSIGTISGAVSWFDPETGHQYIDMAAAVRAPGVVVAQDGGFYSLIVPESGRVTVEVYDLAYEKTGDPAGGGSLPYRLTIAIETDLEVTAPRLDVNDSGSSVHFDYKAWGLLDGPGYNSFQVAVYQSANPTFDTEDTFLGFQAFQLPATRDWLNGTVRLSQPIVQDGERPYLLVVADPDQAIGETGEGQNVASIHLPDIEIRTGPTKLPDGSTVGSDDGVTVWTTGPDSLTYEIGYYHSADPVFDRDEDTLVFLTTTGNGSPAPWIPFDPEKPFTLVKGDPNGHVFEANEENNVAVLGDKVRVTFSSTTGLLQVWGTDDADTISVKQNKKRRISVEDFPIYWIEKREFVGHVRAKRVRDIKIDGRGGEDVIRLDQGKKPIKQTASVFGGEGNDTIHGGARVNFLFGDGGGDEIHGGDRDDRIEGGSGHDRIWGGEGNDLLWGDAPGMPFKESGNDSLYGGLGNDELHGGAGNDKLFGEEGNDWLWAESGWDWLEAGSAEEFADRGDTRGDIANYTFNAHKWIVDEADMTDVKQKASQSCLFLAALASVARTKSFDANHPIRYEGNFEYVVPMFDGTVWTEQRITFDGTYGQRDPDPGTDGEFWTILYQRAYLKMFGLEADSLEQGLYYTAGLEALTGREVTSVPVLRTIPNIDSIFTLMDLAIKGNRNVICGAPGVVGMNPYVPGNHAYTVVKVWPDDQGERWVQIRNPWGRDGTGYEQGDPSDGLINLTFAEFKAAMIMVTVD